jgi:signal transduction histidine kinase
MPSEPPSEVVVILAPTGADATNIARVLGENGMRSVTCSGLEEAAQWVDRAAGALLMTEEALSPTRNSVLVAAFERQPPWSEIPLLLIASDASIHRWATLPTAVLGTRSNVTLVARPLQASTLSAAAQTALRARRRQFEVRDLLAEREALLASLEDRVRERTARLEELVAELESFSYSVSHDLRAPLRVMAGYARIVVDDFGPTLAPDVRHYVERIAHSAERMDLLTQDVLAYTRLARGEMTLGAVNLETLIEETIEQYPELSSVRSAIEVKKPLADVMAHAPSLTQVLSNLLGNAIKFARPGVPLRITVCTEVRKGRVRISVRDNGVGIERGHHHKIFRIFERVAGRDIPGTGIGLAIVKKAAERMDGTVGVDSQPGHGSTFWVELTRAPDPGKA